MHAMQLDLFQLPPIHPQLEVGSETEAFAPPMSSSPKPGRHVSPMSLSAMLLGHVRFLINTPVIVEAQEQLAEWLLGGLLGGVFVGRPRLGKTRAARFCLRALPHLLGFHIPWVEIPLRKDELKGMRIKNDFFAFLLKRLGHIQKRGSVSDKADRFVEYCVAQAKRSGANIFIIYFDEGQKLSVNQLNWILECANEVEVEECRLFILMTAQTEFNDLRDRLVRTSQEQFVARFMLGEFSFRGLMSEEEVCQCLEAYVTTEYPRGSGRTFASNYLDSAPNPSLDLKSLARDFMHEFGLLWKAKISDDPIEIPMHYFTASVIRFLIYRRDPEQSTKTDVELVHMAVERSLFETAVDVRASATKAGSAENDNKADSAGAAS